MGIMTVRDAKDLDALEPQDAGTRWHVIKDGQEVSDVIIQEGVLTNERMQRRAWPSRWST